MQPINDTTQQFDKLLGIENFSDFIEVLCKLLEINRIDAHIEKTTSLKQFQTPGKSLSVDQLVFPININTIFAYASDIYQKSQLLISLELEDKVGLSNVIQTLEALELRIQWAIQNFEKYNPITFFNNVNFYAIHNGRKKIDRIASSLELNLGNNHLDQIQHEISYRFYLLDSIHGLIKEHLSRARYEEKKDAKFIWTSKNPKFDLTEIALAITRMPQFDFPNEASVNIFIKRFLMLFDQPGHKIVHNIGEINRRKETGKVSKQLIEVLENRR